MSRGSDPQPRSERGAERTIDRIAHAFTPVAWKGRSLVIAIVAFAVVGGVTVLQRALLADSVTGWIITAVHGVVVAAAVPLLSIRTVRAWRAARQGVAPGDQPRGVPE